MLNGPTPERRVLRVTPTAISPTAKRAAITNVAQTCYPIPGTKLDSGNSLLVAIENRL